ncbi:MAG TPA: sugar ABC transporter permease [Candidatus Limnocylindrales bacterium]|nr:sugar ABC transporter permease [Candidatus Limnocylindrales bacterium]
MTAARVSAPSKGRWRPSEQTRWAFIFLLPWIIGFIVFTAGPMIATAYLSFTNYNVIRPPTFIGLDNYEQMLTDRRIPLALQNTAFYALFHVPGVILISLALAMILTRVGKLAGLFRTIFYLPSVTPAVAIGTLFLLLLAGNGLVNNTLGFLGINGPQWLTDPDWVKPGIVIMSLWTLGSTVVIYFAALRNVPLELYEAAKIDGANAWQAFRNITLPFISGAIFFTVIVNTIAALQIFAEVFTMFFGARSGPAQGSALFYTIYLFQKAFQDLKFGYASAMAWLLFLIILIITLIQVRLSSRFVFYAGEGR